MSPVWDLQRKDPLKRYLWCFLATPADGQGIDYYRLLGYEVERYVEGGTCPYGMRFEPGQEIQVRGHALMSVSKERHAELVKYGPAPVGTRGDSGQAAADALEKHIIRKRYFNDAFRGIGGIHGRSGAPIMDLVNETGPLTQGVG